MRRVFNRVLYSVISLFILLSIVAITPAMNHQPVSADDPPKLIFQDDFSNPKSGWYTYSSDIGSAKYDNGVYRIIVQRNEWMYSSYNRESTMLNDFIAETDVTMDNGSAQDYCGFLISYAPYAYQYFFRIYPFDGVAVIHSREKMGMSDTKWGDTYRATGYLLRNTNLSCIKSGKQANRLRIVINGKNIKAYINESTILDSYDDALPDLKRLAGAEGGRISLMVGKFTGQNIANYYFDNYKIYHGVNAVIICPEILKESSTLISQVKKLEEQGFTVNNPIYYTSIDNLIAKSNNAILSNPVNLHIVCDPSAKSIITSKLPTTYLGEVTYTEINLLDYTVADLKTNKTSYQPGDTVILKIATTNIGLVDIANGLIKYSVNDVSGTSIYSNEVQFDSIPKSGKKDIEIQVPLPLFAPNGQYRVDAVITANSAGGEAKLITEKKAGIPIQVAGQSPILIIGTIAGILVVGAIIAGIVIYSKKKKKAETKAS